MAIMEYYSTPEVLDMLDRLVPSGLVSAVVAGAARKAHSVGLGLPDYALKQSLGLVAFEYEGKRCYAVTKPLPESAVPAEQRIRIIEPRSPNAPCSVCGKPADTLTCSMGGCPLGADL